MEGEIDRQTGKQTHIETAKGRETERGREGEKER